jgi:hypothetical protein
VKVLATRLIDALVHVSAKVVALGLEKVAGSRAVR